MAKGNQQVTIYPQQDITSINANQQIYGLISAGVYKTGLSISDNPSEILITVAAGTTVVFEREYEGRKFVVKTVLADSYELDPLDKSTAFGNMKNSKSIHVYADWQYNPLAIEHDATFYITDDAGSVALIAQKMMLVGSFGNHQYMYAHREDPSPPSAAGTYRVDYSKVVGLNTLDNLSNQREALKVEFTGDGTGIYIKPGTVWISDLMGYWSESNYKNPLEQELQPGQLFGDPIPPPENAGSAGQYQIDTLRLVTDEEDLSKFKFKWSTKVVVTGETWDFKNMLFTKEGQLLPFLRGQQLNLTDPGYIVLICVRSCNSTDPGTGTIWIDEIWPQNTYVPETYTPRVGEVPSFTRLKLPVHSGII